MATTSPSKRHLGLTSSTLISTSDVTVGGNLIVNGTTTTLNTATLQVEDKNIELNKGGDATSSNLGGITVLRGTSASAQFIWDQGNTRWDISNGLHVDGEIFTKSHGKSSQWATAYGWGNHADGGYIKDFDITTQTDSKYLRSNAADTISSTLTMGTQFALVANGYGRGVFGLYSATRYQHVWGMGTAYKLTDDGTGAGNLYGIAYSHTNKGGETKAGLSHQALFMQNGVTQSAIGLGMWTKGLITTTSYGTSANWKAAYDWGNHADAGYLTTEADPVYTGERDDLRLNKMTHSTLLWSTLADYNRPSGYSTMIQPNSHKNPLPSHGYYHVIARRDGEGGYGSLLQAYNSHELFHGNTTKSTNEISWYNVWNSGDFAKADVTEGATAYTWGDHSLEGYSKTDTTYNFAGTLFTSRNSTNPIAIDSATSNMSGYTNTSTDAGYADGGLFVAAYSSSWVSQIFSNFRTGELSARGKNSGTWQAWRKIHDSGHFSTTDVANGVTAHGWGNHADGGYAASGHNHDDDYLGKTAKAADSETVDGIDSSRIVYGANSKRSTRYDGEGIASINQNSGFYYGYDPDGGPYEEWWNWITVAGASWTSGNNYDFKLAHEFHSDSLYVSRMTNGSQGAWRKIVDESSASYNNGNWDTAYGWGNHASAGYLTSFDITTQTDSKYLRSNANDTFSGSLVSNNRANGIFGTYDSYKTDSIWSMGTSYKNAEDGSNFGSLYGLAYKHTNNTTGGTMAGSHQMVWCHNGSPKSAMGSGLWTSGTVTASGGNSGNWNTAYGWGNHASEGYLKSLPGHNHAGTHPLIETATERGPDFDKLMPEANHTTYKEVHAINEGLNIPSGYTYGVVKSQYMGSMKYQEYVPHTASRGSSATQDTIWFRTNWGSNSWYAWRYHIHSGNIGSQSVDNASKLDGIDSGSFLRSDANDSASGSYSFTNSYNEFGNSTSSVSNDGSWNGRVNIAGSSHARLDVKSVSDGIITTMYAHTGHGAGKVGTMSSHPIQFMTGGQTRGQVNDKGVLHMSGDIVGYYSFSDRRLKTNVKPLENNLEKVLAMHPVSYQWKEGDRKGSTDIGLIAQEVEEIVPEVVREQERLEGSSTKTYKTVDYEHLVSVLIGAVKEQQEQINELKSKMCKCNGK